MSNNTRQNIRLKDDRSEGVEVFVNEWAIGVGYSWNHGKIKGSKYLAPIQMGYNYKWLLWKHGEQDSCMQT